MGDWFDLNNDGKLDPFEEACKWSYINNGIEYLKKEEEKRTNARRALYNELYDSMSDTFNDSTYNNYNASTYNTYNNPVNNAYNNPADNTK